MKRLLLILAIISLLVVGCDSGVSQEEYDEVVAQRELADAKAQELQQELDKSQEDNEALQTRYDNVVNSLSEANERIDSLESELDSLKNPKPSPAPTPTPSPTPKPSPKPTQTPSPKPTPTLTPVPTPTPEGTEVSGIIAGDTIWREAKSPYTVVGKILVPSGTTLTIEPGVTVQFEESKLSWEAFYIEVEGKLIAKGEQDKPITFTSTGQHQWGGIVLSGELSLIEHCIIEQGGGRYEPTEGRRNTLIVIWNSSSSVRNSTIRLTGGDALYIKGYAEITDNQIESGAILVDGGDPFFSYNYVSGSGIFICQSSATITRNEINGNEDYGIRIDGPASPSITYNNIVNNSSYGIFIVAGNDDSTVTVEHNNIYGNEDFSVMLSNTTRDYNFFNNWWGTPSTSEIDSSIYDYNDDWNLGKVNYSPIAGSEIADAGVP